MKSVNNSVATILILFALAITMGYKQKPSAADKRDSRNSGLNSKPSFLENKTQDQKILISEKDSSLTQSSNQKIKKVNYENLFISKN